MTQNQLTKTIIHKCADTDKDYITYWEQAEDIIKTIKEYIDNGGKLEFSNYQELT